MLFNECINLLATLPIIANFNRMAVMTKMNASPLTCVISMDVEDPSTAQCHIWGASCISYKQEWIQKVGALQQKMALW